ncbi:hypothetical protein [uncultured Ilyobacter sp.]|uniref:hypothetical protein n=1 Tax=uncultured Ilyobacter sp. TaxID=544433 RepID=UPI0029C8E972|nr:hypothetical protein [uncultured Ilyobacter sp.]
MSFKKNIVIIFFIFGFSSFAVGISTLIIREKRPGYDVDAKIPYLIRDGNFDRTNREILNRFNEMQIQIEEDYKKKFNEFTNSNGPKVILKGEYTVRASDSKMVLLIVKNRYFLNGYDVQVNTYNYTLSPSDGKFYSREDIFIDPSYGVYQIKNLIKNEIRNRVRQTKTGESVNIYLNDISLDMDYGGFYLEKEDLIVELEVKGAPPYYDGWKKFKIPLKKIKELIKSDIRGKLETSSSKNINLN